MRVLGIDPGRTGGLCILSGDVRITQAMKSLSDTIDLKWLVEWLEEFRGEFDHAIIEEVHAIYGSSAGATFSFGRTCGHLEGALSSLRIPYSFVRPKEWQKHYGFESKKGMTTKDKKQRCIRAAQQLFPTMDFRESERSKVPHLGIVDAVLIANWGVHEFRT